MSSGSELVSAPVKRNVTNHVVLSGLSVSKQLTAMGDAVGAVGGAVGGGIEVMGGAVGADGVSLQPQATIETR